MGIDRARIHPAIARPDAGQQLIARQHAADVLSRITRQFELALGQIDIDTGQANASPVEIDLDATTIAADPQLCWRNRADAP